MTDRVHLGWRVPEDVWDVFTAHVAEKHGSTAEYLRFEVELAMREFLDEDELQARAEHLLGEYTDLQGLSSSTATASIGTDRYHGDTRLVQQRINADLKERFAIFADEHNAASYGRALAKALDAYARGGRLGRILDDVERLVTGDQSVEAQPGVDENSDRADGEGGSTAALDESSFSSSGGSASTADTPTDGVDVEARLVLGVVEELPDPEDLANTTLPATVLNETIVDVVGTGKDDVLAAYREAVLEQLNAHQHPHKSDRYITEAYRESHRIYADMERSECVYALRRFAALNATEDRCLKKKYTYKQVQELFEWHAGNGSPSHDFAYTLMREAAKKPGFDVGKHHGQLQLCVDLDAVSSSVMAFVRDEGAEADLDALGVNARLEDYGAGSPPDTEGVADD